MATHFNSEEIKIGVVGLGYVGMPLALAFAEKFEATIGYDVDERKVALLRDGVDPTYEGFEQQIRQSSLAVTSRLEDLKGCNFIVITVPTPIDMDHRPDLRHVTDACEAVAKIINPGTIIVFESTVYPGLTEEVCGPIIEKMSGLKPHHDYKLAYSPERVNPGDRDHTLQKIVKVVSGEDKETLEIVSAVYGQIIEAGIHQASSIRVAEAAKVIENTQRDLNIALMNELALIFDRMGISTKEVLDAASTKWNFIRFNPGLVGGHCIGVDPFYLTTKAEQLGYHPQVILAGRRINDCMGKFIGQKMVKLLVRNGIMVKGARVGILGLTFKENVSDIRNSRVPDIILELKEFGVEPLVHDPLAKEEDLHHEYSLSLTQLEKLYNLDGLIFAVPHAQYLKEGIAMLERLKERGVFIDVKSMIDRAKIPQGVEYWSL
jgi:UDP-N-acetyl-D-galactosamine dehydrogenase